MVNITYLTLLDFGTKAINQSQKEYRFYALTPRRTLLESDIYLLKHPE